jgi:hypothetical protein
MTVCVSLVALREINRMKERKKRKKQTGLPLKGSQMFFISAKGINVRF